MLLTTCCNLMSSFKTNPIFLMYVADEALHCLPVLIKVCTSVKAVQEHLKAKSQCEQRSWGIYFTFHTQRLS